MWTPFRIFIFDPLFICYPVQVPLVGFEKFLMISVRLKSFFAQRVAQTKCEKSGNHLIAAQVTQKDILVSLSHSLLILFKKFN